MPGSQENTLPTWSGSPFAALTGYYDLVRERERVTEPRREPSEEESARISGELAAGGEEHGIQIRIQREEIFNAMHKI